MLTLAGVRPQVYLVTLAGVRPQVYVVLHTYLKLSTTLRPLLYPALWSPTGACSGPLLDALNLIFDDYMTRSNRTCEATVEYLPGKYLWQNSGDQRPTVLASGHSPIQAFVFIFLLSVS